MTSLLHDKNKWLAKPNESNYPAALSYLSLLFTPAEAGSLVVRMRKTEVVCFRAKDIFRASRLSMLPQTNFHVKKNIKKMRGGERLSPILLVRDTDSGKVIIADGYHRMCGVYLYDEDAWIPCQIISR